LTGKVAFDITISAKANTKNSEQVIQQLLKENGTTSLLGGIINVSAVGVEAAPGSESVRSPET
jgi:hypothetical protein